MKKLRIILVFRAYSQMSQLRKTIAELAQRGHFVLVVIHKNLAKETIDEIRSIENSPHNVSYEWARFEGRIRFSDRFVFHSRELLSYRKHLLHSDEKTQFYPKRWKRYIHPKLQKLFGWSFARFLLKTGLCGMVLHLVEVLTPAPGLIIRHLMEFKPDMVVVSPVNLRYSSADLEYLKAAVQLKIPTILPMTSWDNITAKGLYHIWPDRFLLWNFVQVEQIFEHQGVSSERVRIIGATTMDQWCPSPLPTSRRNFCQTHNLRQEDPIISYFGGSSLATWGDESHFVDELRKVLDRSGDERLRKTQIIVRPHPRYYQKYEKIVLRDVHIVPQGKFAWNQKEFSQIFYDTIYHSAAIVGVNTSAMLDVIVIDRPVISILEKQHDHTQADTYHFPELIKSGAIYLKKLDEIEGTLIDIFDERNGLQEKRKQFVADHLMPRGLGISVGEIIADEIEQLVEEKQKSGKPVTSFNAV